jgi:IclR family pca regulon transcriptional regulator
MTLSEIARVTGMSRATVRRFLLTLVKEGYAETDGKYFGLRPKVLELGYAALSSMTMLDVMQPIMTRLAETVQESVFAAVLEETDVVYIASAAPPDRIVSISVSVGSRAPAHCVSSGRILVASLSEFAALSRRPASRTGQSSTRSSRSDCGRYRHRSATVRARLWPH